MNIFIKELKDNKKPLFFWCLGSIFLIASGMGKYAALSTDQQAFNDLMAQLPKAVQVVFGIGSLNLNTASGFYGLLFLYMILVATIYAITFGCNIIAKEERDKTSEFLMVKPVSRNKIVASKILAAIFNLVVFNLVNFITSLIAINAVSKDEDVTKLVILLTIATFILQLLFLSIGTALAAVYKDSKKSTSIASAILLVTFFISIIVDLNDKLEFLKYITPFKYFEAKIVIANNGLNTVFVILSLVLFAVFTYVTFVSYRKRDLMV